MPSEQSGQVVEQHQTDQESTKAPSTRILVADDEKSIRTIVGYALSHEGWEVTTVEDGNDVAKVLEACATADPPFDLAILDIDMPNMNGYEAYRRIHACFPGLPVLFMSGWPRETVWNDSVRAETNEATEFVAKPFSISFLVEKVRGLLART